MDVEDKKMLQYLLCYAAITAAAMCAIAYLCRQPTAANDSSATGYVERIESTADRAAAAIGDGSGRIDAADNKERIERLQNIIDGCVKRNQQATELVKRIKDTNRQGAE